MRFCISCMEEGRCDPESMTEPRTQCRKCGTSILAVTAGRFDGRCAPCWSRRPSRRILVGLGNAVAGILEFIALPFIMAWEYAAIVRRRRRFPFPLGALRKQVEAVYQDRRDVRIYLSGLIRGYFEPGIFMLPANPRDMARHYGFQDGVALGKGRIAVAELPSRRFQIDHSMISPHPDRKVR